MWSTSSRLWPFNLGANGGYCPRNFISLLKAIWSSVIKEMCAWAFLMEAGCLMDPQAYLEIYRYAASWWSMTMWTRELGGSDLTVSNQEDLRSTRLCEDQILIKTVFSCIWFCEASVPPHICGTTGLYICINPILEKVSENKKKWLACK